MAPDTLTSGSPPPAGRGRRHVTLCVTGGIAAYKSCTLLRDLMRAGVEVDVLMTAAAQRFVSRLTFEALAQRPVRADAWERGDGIAHVELAARTDLIVVAPATANSIARFAAGLADDLVSATVLASCAPVLLAPAMETGMWRNPITAANVDRLEATGRFHRVGPESGALASGRSGEGRMSEPEAIAARALQLLGDGALVATPPAPAPPRDVETSAGTSPPPAVRRLAGLRAVVTAGPTREHLDPVRFLTNPSTGKMGFAVAAALAEQGAEVTLVHGPVSLEAPAGVGCVPVTSAAEMCEAVMERARELDVYVGTAAIADFTPARVEERKIKKEGSGSGRSLVLVRTADVIATLVRRLGEMGRREAAVVVGFAVETQDLERYAKDKLERKGLDMIAANDVSDPSYGFASDANRLLVLDRDGGRHEIGPGSKPVVARALVERIADRLAVVGRVTPAAGEA